MIDLPFSGVEDPRSKFGELGFNVCKKELRWKEDTFLLFGFKSSFGDRKGD